ncbi:MAG: serine hydrolase [Chloroflexi bacterium]|nr:serine hydrolase [Chloroflexota bacterium]
MNALTKICLCITLILLIAGCAQPQPEAVSSSDAVQWPTSGWKTAGPEQQGVDAQKLAEMQAYIEQSGLNLHSLLIVRNGYIVSETYYNGSSQSAEHELFSVTKSVIATLIGMAVDQAKLAIDQPVSDFLPVADYANPSPSKQAMTVEDLLTMTSGLDWPEVDSTFRSMYMSRDWVRWVMDLPMREELGETFLYCSGCSHVLSAILQQSVGMTAEEYAKRNLFAPLGIRDYSWEKDAQGISVGGWGLSLTARDMAKLGYLYLRNGEWDGEQILSQEWIAAAASKHVDTDGDLGYGYQWWIYPDYGAYTALGRDGQTIFVIPDMDLVIVTTAKITNHDPIFDLIDQYIVPAVVE